MAQRHWFYRNADEWASIRERLKLTPCPHCGVVGMLICHGSLWGSDDSSPGQRTIRAQRIYCSNRHARSGCGRTFSIWLADKIRYLSLTTGCLWRFLQRLATGTIVVAIAAVKAYHSDRTWQRIWRRFRQNQSHIRTALSNTCPPPELPADPPARPMVHVLAHLRTAFPDADCPIAAFQQAMGTFIV